MYLKSPIHDAASSFIGPAERLLTLIFFDPKSTAKYLTEASRAALAHPLHYSVALLFQIHSKLM